MEKKQLKEYSWVIRGKQRKDILKKFKETETPAELAKKSGYSLNNTSRVLNDLKKHRLARCLNPKEKTGRLYVLTKTGKLIKKKIES